MSPGLPTGCAPGRRPTPTRTPAFDRLVRALSGFLGEIAGRTPPDIESPGLGDALAGLQLGRTFRGLGRDDGRTITRVLPMAVADFVAESFETDALQAAIAWRGVQYTSMGPWSAGTTAVLLTDSAGNDGGAAGQTVFARGGPGALAAALAAAARAAGVEIRTDAEVARSRRVTAGRRASCSPVARRSRHVPSSPASTRSGLLTGLADPVAVGPSLLWRADNIRTPGTVAKVNLVLCRAARFPAAGRRRPGSSAVGSSSRPASMRWSGPTTPPSTAAIRTQPMMEATIPSLADPSLVEGAAPGTHVMSVIVQATPYSLRDSTWDEARRPSATSWSDARFATRPGWPGS